MWDLCYFFSSLWASCTPLFRGVPLLILQLNWLAVGGWRLPTRIGVAWVLVTLIGRGFKLLVQVVYLFLGRKSHPSIILLFSSF